MLSSLGDSTCLGSPAEARRLGLKVRAAATVIAPADKPCTTRLSDGRNHPTGWVLLVHIGAAFALVLGYWTTRLHRSTATWMSPDRHPLSECSHQDCASSSISAGAAFLQRLARPTSHLPYIIVRWQSSPGAFGWFCAALRACVRLLTVVGRVYKWHLEPCVGAGRTACLHSP